ncbi:hypothetical protein [Microbulbifer pacificus]|uniref:hypothetical protein n=1 Tax=Microbulbifer pacificus TaxID=407164 RepID=UPI000CF3A4CD|nr:hypothetical protein [Microbulbifer pacificus]
MGRWTRHLEALTQAISGIGATPVAGAPDGDPVVDGPLETDVAGEPPVATTSIEQALMQGMEVTLGDLRATEHGWLYRGSPVMVFAVDVAAVDDVQVRREFFQRIHLTSCCGALEDPGQVVWIGTAREVLAAPGLSAAPHACEYCLAKVNHRGFRGLGPRDRSRVAEALSFHWHVSQYAAEYFPESDASFWRPGAPVQSLPQIAPESAASGSCGFCNWQVPAGREWFVPVERGLALGLSVDACVLCAQQQAMGVLALADDSALEASRMRWLAQTDTGDALDEESGRDWSWVRRQLPLAWHPLCEQLERRLSPPDLFYHFAGYEGVAVLAWPEHRRGIVASEDERAKLPEGWDFWTMRSVLGSLG